ncbi:M protein [Puerto Almendras virus]|uniref:M protein n=1 Tax=Puerto Almendras virus TaxID=1479613 RepID=X4QQM6_9RHAB|nr:M protein [Puerto Almendras virus]AHU86504.1 M protein [Puerto Almendras virus]
MFKNSYIMTGDYSVRVFKIRYESSFETLPSDSDIKPMIEHFDGKLKFLEVFTFILNYMVTLQIRNKVKTAPTSIFVIKFPVDSRWMFKKEEMYSMHKDIYVENKEGSHRLRVKLVVDLHVDNRPRDRLVRPVMKKILSKLYDTSAERKMYEIMKENNEC